MSTLTSVNTTIDALGGVKPVMRITGSEYKTVHSWRARKRFPRWTFIIITSALSDRGLSGDPRLWRMGRNSNRSGEKR